MHLFANAVRHYIAARAFYGAVQYTSLHIYVLIADLLLGRLVRIRIQLDHDEPVIVEVGLARIRHNPPLALCGRIRDLYRMPIMQYNLVHTVVVGHVPDSIRLHRCYVSTVTHACTCSFRHLCLPRR